MKTRKTLQRELLKLNNRERWEKSLKVRGLWDDILRYTTWMPNNIPEYKKVKQRVSYVLQGCPSVQKCRVCAKPCAWQINHFSEWCGIVCRNKDPQLNKILSEKQTKNAPERFRKSKITWMKTLGVDHPLKSKTVIESLKRNRIDNDFEQSLLTISKHFPEIPQNKLTDKEFWRDMLRQYGSMQSLAKSHGTWAAMLQRWWEKIEFEDYPRTGNTSGGEKMLGDWLESRGFNIIRNDRQLLDGKEIDIFLPEFHVGIEYDGLYWHKDDQTLSHKQQEAAKKGVRLIRIFEDEWEQKQPIIKSIILAKLGKFEHRYYARKLDKKEVSGKEAYAFMLENHLQGPKSTQKHIALCEGSEIIAMVSISSKNELERFATKLNCQVVGGLAKLISKEHDLFTYVDRRFSPIAEETGYNQMGQFLGSTQPGYFWVKNNHREPRWQFQKHKLEKKLGHPVDLTKTETQIMEEEGYYKLYDCGHWKFMLNPLMPYKGKTIIEKPIIKAPYIPLF